jgi:hypothetical protein
MVFFDAPVSPCLTGDLALLCSTAGCGSQALQGDRGPTGGTTGPAHSILATLVLLRYPTASEDEVPWMIAWPFQPSPASLCQPRISAVFRRVLQGLGPAFGAFRPETVYVASYRDQGSKPVFRWLRPLHYSRSPIAFFSAGLTILAGMSFINS